MKLTLRVAALLALALLLTACKPIKFASAQEEAVAQGWIAELRARHFEAIERTLDPALPADDREAVLARMADTMPAGAPTSVKLVGDQHMTSSAGHVVNLTYEYEFTGRWVLANVAVKTNDGVTTIIGLNVFPIPRSLEEHNRFSLEGKPALSYVVLALAVVNVAVTILALVMCVRTRLRGRKWPWILVIFVGVGQLTLDWTTGQCQFSPLAVVFFSAGAMAVPYGPWFISLGFPVGALVFLVRRLSLMAPPPVPQPAEPIAQQ